MLIPFLFSWLIATFIRFSVGITEYNVESKYMSSTYHHSECFHFPSRGLFQTHFVFVFITMPAELYISLLWLYSIYSLYYISGSAWNGPRAGDELLPEAVSFCEVNYQLGWLWCNYDRGMRTSSLAEIGMALIWMTCAILTTNRCGLIW